MKFSVLRFRARTCAVAALLLAVALAAWANQLGYSTTVSASLVRQYAARFGETARERLGGWQGFMKAQRSAAPDLALLATVNRHFNRVRFLDDLKHWGAEDYWATPAEFFSSDGGDCEDFSIAKYYALRELGLPVSRLRITYVRSAKIAQPHMVLAYYAASDAEPLILDNLEDDVRPASQRPDLVPVYSFNDEAVEIASRGRAGSPAQLRMWRELIARLEREART